MVGRGACLRCPLASGGETEGVPWRHQERWKKKDASQAPQSLHHTPKTLLRTLFLQTITDGRTDGPMGGGGKRLLGGGLESGEVLFKCPVALFFLIRSHVLAEGDKNGGTRGVSADDVQSMGLDPCFTHVYVGAGGRFELDRNHGTIIVDLKVRPSIDSFRMTFVADTWGTEDAVMVEKTLKGLLVSGAAASEKLGGAMEGMEEVLETVPDRHCGYCMRFLFVYTASCLLPQTASAM